MDQIKIGGFIAIRRKEKGWTQSQLAEVLGITDKAVSKWERDLSCPDIQSLPRLAEILGVSVEELMQGETRPASLVKRINEIVDLVLKALVDLHRDSAPRSASILESDGVTYAKMMFVVGMKSSNAAHVMEHSRQLTDKINQVMPGIMRSVFERQSVYNQDMAENMVLLELGTDQNSTEEVRHSLRILVEALTNGGIE